MTYCAAVHVEQGLVFVSDSRTNAGVDQLSTYSKMFRFGVPRHSALVLLTAGNLATTQAVVKSLTKDIDEAAQLNLTSVSSIDEAAAYVGTRSVHQQRKHADTTAGSSVDISASYILGGQIGSEEPAIYLIYPEGNYIAATDRTPYQQIGEVKYGKPILDRIISTSTSLEEAALCALVSMDSTMRSNATVGPPIELLAYERDTLELHEPMRLEADDPYLLELRSAWERELRRGFAALPRPAIRPSVNPGGDAQIRVLSERREK